MACRCSRIRGRPSAGASCRTELIEDLAGAGLFGLEADHEDHSQEERTEIRALADALGLVVTGSSDFHGTHKTVRLGAFQTATEAYEKIVAAATGVPVLG